ncbi:hypothetical protein J7M28_11390, partial [bacterium]|nr:hypothetical protein [bacterium]
MALRKALGEFHCIGKPPWADFYNQLDNIFRRFPQLQLDLKNWARPAGMIGDLTSSIDRMH